MSSASIVWYSFWSPEKLHKLSRSRESHLQLMQDVSTGISFLESPLTSSVVFRNWLSTVAPPSWRPWPTRCQRYRAIDCQAIYETLLWCASP